jgi:Flp pilus assembly protein TadB
MIADQERTTVAAKQAKPKRSSSEQFMLVVDRIAGRLRENQHSEHEEVVSLLDRIDAELERAGVRDKIDAYRAIAIGLICLAAAVLPFLWYALGIVPVWMAGIMALFFIGFPYLKLKQLKNKRQGLIRRDVPAITQELTMSLATLTIDDALRRVAENAVANPEGSPLGQELLTAVQEYRSMGRDREEALFSIVRRTGSDEVLMLIDTLVTGLRTGHDGLVEALEGFLEQVTNMQRQHVRAFIGKQQPLFVLCLVMTMFGAFILWAAPLMISMLHTMSLNS